MELTEDTLSDYKLWRINVRNDMPAYLAYLEMKEKADRWDECQERGIRAAEATERA